MEAVAARLAAGGLLRELIPARDASDEEIERVHARGYLELVERESAGSARARYLSTGDAVIDATSAKVARRAAGGAIAALQAAVSQRKPVFALVRPPGHHAEPDRGMGFCLFNNVAIAARALQAAGGGRVLIADFDYHHGNGTEAIAGAGVSYCSTHAYPAYPGTGLRSFRRGDDVVINVPLPVTGVSTEAFVAVWEELLPSVARVVRPDAIVVSAGFDYVAGDGVGDLGIDVSAAAPVAAALRRVAEEVCDGALAYVLEGGYGIEAIASSIAAIAQINDRSAAPSAQADPGAIPRDVHRRLQESLSLCQGG